MQNPKAVQTRNKQAVEVVPYNFPKGGITQLRQLRSRKGYDKSPFAFNRPSFGVTQRHD